jgi:hypothetical protein
MVVLNVLQTDITRQPASIYEAAGVVREQRFYYAGSFLASSSSARGVRTRRDCRSPR